MRNPRKPTAPTPPENTSVNDPVLAYAKDVVEGRELAGPLVRKACQRHLDDIRTGELRSVWWDLPSALRAIGFFEEVLKLAGGEHEGKPFLLHGSQKFIVGSLFGWKGADGYRRFRVAYIEEGKGNGKSPLAAGIGLYMLTADRESRAEVYSAAVDKDQAKVLFRDAVAMVDQSQELNSRMSRSGTAGKEWNLAFLETGSFFRPISSEAKGRGKSGPRPHCAILDEVHEHPTPAMVEFMRAGTKGRRQALILMITNSGVYDPFSVCWTYHNYSERILNGVEENDAFFSYVCAFDPGDDWKDPTVWKKVNPLLGVAIPEKYLAEQVREAVGMPSKQSIVRRLNFCEWVEALNPFIDPEIWKANGAPVFIDSLRGRKCYGGLDLSGKNDLSSLVFVFPNADETKDVLAYFWTPKDTLREREERDRAPYSEWVASKHIVATPGRSIDYRYIAQALGSFSKMFKIEGIAFDRYRIDDMVRELDAEGVDIELIEHGQGFRDMSPAVEALEDDLLSVRLRHGQNPVLTTCVANLAVVSDPSGLRKFDKRKATGRIDGAVALAMAVNLAATKQTKKPEFQFFTIGK